IFIGAAGAQVAAGTVANRHPARCRFRAAPRRPFQLVEAAAGGGRTRARFRDWARCGHVKGLLDSRAIAITRWLSRRFPPASISFPAGTLNEPQYLSG